MLKKEQENLKKITEDLVKSISGWDQYEIKTEDIREAYARARATTRRANNHKDQTLYELAFDIINKSGDIEKAALNTATILSFSINQIAFFELYRVQHVAASRETLNTVKELIL